MFKKAIKFIIFPITILLTVSATLTDYNCIELPSSFYNYSNIPFPIDILNNITEMDNMPTNNPTTDAGATLGRVLFYDVDLSKNRTISCASCHIQKFSFTDTAKFSKGFDGRLTGRNSMSLAHARFQKDSSFFWDNRATSLEIQVLMPIKSDVEMGLTMDTLVTRVKAKPFYPKLFLDAFGTSEIDTTRIARAIAQFVRSMNTFGSKYRQGVNSTIGNPSIVPFANFTVQENLGKDLFMDEKRGNCQACHTRNIFVPQGSKNIGLDLVYKDNGVGEAFKNSTKNGQFSVPSLINAELTFPYMHDGRFKTLEEVIDFYSDSIKPHPNLSGFLREILPGTIDPNNHTCDTCPPRKIQYTKEEKAALLAFLKTLTDTILTTDKKWGDPFCKSRTSGVKALQSILDISIYPNPVKQHEALTITLFNGQNYQGFITIYNASGRKIHSFSLKAFLGKQDIKLQNLNLTSGTYHLIIESEQGTKTSKKIIVE